jgi:hypothetical protein
MASATGAGSERVGRPGWRPLRVVSVAVLVVVAVFLVWIVGLLLTNPRPSPSPGWERHADAPRGRGETGSAVRGAELWVIGGFVGLASTSAAVVVYDSDTDTWRSAPDLPEARHHPAGATIDGVVYVTGGATSAFDWTPRTNTWMLEEGAAAWGQAEPMPEGRQGHDMVALDGRLYVVGGEGETTSVLVYEPGVGWSAGAELGQVRDHVRAVVVAGTVWAIGGRDGDLTGAVTIYDPPVDRWLSGPPLPQPMSAMAVGVLDGAVHVVSGEDDSLLGGRVFDQHFVLAPGATEWEPAPEPILAVHGSSFGVIDGRLFLAGGSPRQGVLSPLAWSTVTQSFGGTPPTEPGEG